MGVKQLTPVAVPRRRTFTKKWEENQAITLDLPKDTVLVGLHIRLKGYTKYSYSAGTPTARAEGAMDSLINAIEVSTDRLGTVKYLKPHFLHMQQILSQGVEAERLFAVGATSTDYPTTQGAPTFGTTGQFTSISESIYLPFEQIFCEPGMGRELTYLNTKRSTSATLKFYCNALANLCANPGSVTALAFDAANTKLDLEITTVERQDVDSNVVFKIWKQIQKSEPFSGKVDDKAIDINSENKLSGLAFYCLDGATVKVATSKLLSKVVLKKNGQESLQEIGFGALQNVNRIDYGVIAAFSAGSSRMDGYAYLSQISRKDIGTALDTSRETGGVNSLQLMVSTNASPTVDYTAPATLNIVTEEILEGM